MKEIIALHDTILALGVDFPFGIGIDFSRDDISDEIDLLPEALQAEVESLQEAINEVLPEDFDYLVFLAFPDEPASFGLEYDLGPAGSSTDGTFLPERSLIEQLRELDWEERRAEGRKFREQMDGIIRLNKIMSGPLRSAKAWQREFREDTKDFIKEKRKDAARIHVMYWDDKEGVMETAFEDGEAFRKVLPGFVAHGAEVITIVAGGKPLPVERIDALMSEAQKILRAEIAAKAREMQEAEPQEVETLEVETLEVETLEPESSPEPESSSQAENAPGPEGTA